MGSYYHDQYDDGNRDVIEMLTGEEANLLHARQLARANRWWDALIGTMQGLQVFYDHTGRRAEWMVLVDEIVPDFVDLATDGPVLGREDQWGLVTQYRVQLAREARQWVEAERLQRPCVEWWRKNAVVALALPPDQLEGPPRNVIRTLAMSLGTMGQIQSEQGMPDCVASVEEAAQLLHRIGDRPAGAIAALNLGNAYKNIPSNRSVG